MISKQLIEIHRPVTQKVWTMQIRLSDEQFQALKRAADITENEHGGFDPEDQKRLESWASMFVALALENKENN